MLQDDAGDRASVVDKASAMMKVLDRMFRDRARNAAAESKKTGGLRASNEINQALLDQLPDSVLLVGRDGNLIFANKRFCSRFGCDPEDAVGAPLKSFFCNDGHYFEIAPFIDRAMSDGVATSGLRFDRFVSDIKPFELGGQKSGAVMLLIRTVAPVEH
ncbi:PAS domain-containing protein [Rhizobium sp. FKL33]|uniref:PAS domain-containing protein n=1 Tax=Rhizobium sp. FKL33 TaxID=2562307 RepID=UPI001484FA6A|nr:PAS domain-containing protein [Rhizobium sp. FKL33]